MSEPYSDTRYFLLSAPGDVSSAVVHTLGLDMLREGSETDRSLIATMVSELGSNIVKYAGRGTIRVCRLEQQGAIDIDIWAEDRGPGIADAERALGDHFSTGGSLGLGLPGVRRMSDEFRITDNGGTGTRVFARKRIRARSRHESLALAAQRPLPPEVQVEEFGLENRWDAGSALRTCEGFRVGGDAVVAVPAGNAWLLGVIDASGHGQRAHQIAEATATFLRAEARGRIEVLFERLHGLLQGTAGAAVGLFAVHRETGAFRYAGLGNTRAAAFGHTTWRGLSTDGIVGTPGAAPKLQRGTLRPGDVVVLWTDGLPEAATGRLAEALSFRPAGAIARELVAQLARSYDDAGCLVLKWQR